MNSLKKIALAFLVAQLGLFLLMLLFSALHGQLFLQIASVGVVVFAFRRYRKVRMQFKTKVNAQAANSDSGTESGPAQAPSNVSKTAAERGPAVSTVSPVYAKSAVIAFKSHA